MTEPREIFQTERLRARHIADTDANALYAVYSDAEAMLWVDDGEPISREECLRWIEVTQDNYATRGYGMSALVLASSGAVIGFCGIVHPGGQPEPEIKYALLRDHWGRGLATEAVRGMIAYGEAQLALRRIIATVDLENEASQRVLRKVGMSHLETVRADGSSIGTFVWCAGGGGG